MILVGPESASLSAGDTLTLTIQNNESTAQDFVVTTESLEGVLQAQAPYGAIRVSGGGQLDVGIEILGPTQSTVVEDTLYVEVSKASGGSASDDLLVRISLAVAPTPQPLPPSPPANSSGGGALSPASLAIMLLVLMLRYRRRRVR